MKLTINGQQIEANIIDGKVTHTFTSDGTPEILIHNETDTEMNNLSRIQVEEGSTQTTYEETKTTAVGEPHDVEGFSKVSDSAKKYMGHYSSIDSEASEDFKDYEWSLIRGQDGRDGLTGEAGADGPPGEAATSYWLTSSADTVNRNYSDGLNPTQISFHSYNKTGVSSTANEYRGRFIIQTSPNGRDFTTRYISSSDEYYTTYVIPEDTYFIRARFYMAGGTSSLLAEKTVPVLTTAGGIQIDAENLLLDSHHPKTGDVYNINTFTATRDFVPGELLTVTVKGNIEGDKLFGIWFNGSSLGTRGIPEVREGVYSKQVIVPSGTTSRSVGLYLVNNQSDGDDWTFESIKLESGNISTGWSPAPGDIDKAFEERPTYEDFTDTTSQVEINGGNITAGEIASSGRYSWLNLDNGRFNFGRGALVWSGNKMTIQGDLDVSSTLSADSINAGTLTSQYIASGAITTDKLGANAVTAGKIKSEEITSDHISSQGITADKVTSGRLVGPNPSNYWDLGTGSFRVGDTVNYLEWDPASNQMNVRGSIHADSITAGQIDSEYIAGLPASKITSGTFLSSRIPNLSAGKIRSGTISGYNTYNYWNLTNGDFRIGNASRYLLWDQSRGVLEISGDIHADNISAGTINAARIGNYSISSTKIASNAVTPAKIDVSSLDAISANIGTVTAGRLQSANGNSYFDLDNNNLVTNNARITGGSVNISSSSTTDIIQLRSGTQSVRMSTGQFHVMQGSTGVSILPNQLHFPGRGTGLTYNHLDFSGNAIVSATRNNLTLIANQVIISNGILNMSGNNIGSVGYMTMNGNIAMNGNFIVGESDIRLKENIKPTTVSGIEETKKLNIYDFNWRADHPRTADRSRETQLGMIAQYSPFLEIQPDEKHHYSAINSSKQLMLNTLTNIETIERLEALEEKVENLDGEVDELKEKNQALEDKLNKVMEYLELDK